LENLRLDNRRLELEIEKIKSETEKKSKQNWHIIIRVRPCMCKRNFKVNLIKCINLGGVGSTNLCLRTETDRQTEDGQTYSWETHYAIFIGTGLFMVQLLFVRCTLGFLTNDTLWGTLTLLWGSNRQYHCGNSCPWQSVRGNIMG
jgi:hypothetical protein